MCKMKCHCVLFIVGVTSKLNVVELTWNSFKVLSFNAREHNFFHTLLWKMVRKPDHASLQFFILQL